MQFTQLNLSQEVLQAVNALGFSEATEIQEKSIPVLLDGKDVIGRSHTGTGKTAAFGIPAIERISHEDKKTVQVLIMCPTRELAMQACLEIEKFSKFMPWVKPVAVYGGASMERQIFALKRGANIVVGTPGRLIDHIERRTLKLDSLKTVILDEADEMLNMGFREDIEKILEGVPEERQTVLFSATMPAEIIEISKKYLNNPVHIKVESPQRTVASIEQVYYDVPRGSKLDALVLLFLAYEPKLTIIFCNTKKMVDELTESLNAKGLKASGIHGDMKQVARTQVMERFKSGRTPILIATDVAARGIDVDNVDAVINFDIPQDNEYYIHRIGRTGRAGKAGKAITLISGRKQFLELKDIQKFIKAEIHQQMLPTVKEIKKKKIENFKNKLLAVINDKKHEEYYDFLKILSSESIDAETIAAALLSMQLSKEIKNIPEVESVHVIKKPDESVKNVSSSKNCKLVISAGRMQRLAPNFILGALVEATGLSGKSFGKIEIFNEHTTVEIPESETDGILKAMNNYKINGIKVNAEIIRTKNKDDRRPSSKFSKNSKHHHNKRNSFKQR